MTDVSEARTYAEISPAYFLAAYDPLWAESLEPADHAIGPENFALWLRPEQYIPTHRWRLCLLAGGRGIGKTTAIGRYVNRRVEAGLETRVALMAPTEPRIDEVCIKALIETADPWFMPERWNPNGKIGVRWPNGVEAIGFTPEREGRARGSNYSLAWCTEIVDWKPGTRDEAFRNLALATRLGEERIICDSTAKGRNDLRTMIEEMHARDPSKYVIIGGTTFDNPMYSDTYLRSVWVGLAGVRREEELFGKSFRESAGALWKQAWLDRTRVDELPALGLEWLCVAVDPALSDHTSADETGLCIGGRGRDGHAYVLEDLSTKYAEAGWARVAVEQADPRKPGPKRGRVVVETNRIGDTALEVVKAHAEARGLRFRRIERGDPWPAWDGVTICVRKIHTERGKGTRAEGPAAKTELGEVHLVDPEHAERPRFADLEAELTTFVEGVGKSPNRLDALSYLVTELLELRENSPPDYAREAAAAAAMNAELQTRLRGGSTAAAAPAGVGAALSGLVAGGRRMGL